MKTMLKLISLFLAAGIPSGLAAELAGVSLPPMFDTLHLLAAFVAVTALLTMLTDYQRITVIRLTATAARPVRSAKAVYPLAA